MSDPRADPSKMLDLNSPVIAVTVGSESEESAPRTFYIHKNLICSSSDYFKTIMGGEGVWKDCQNGQVSLKKQNPDIFAIYGHWLYFRRFEFGTDVFENEREFLQIAQALVLGDFICDSKFTNAVATAIRTKLDSLSAGPLPLFPGARVIDYIYNETEDKSIAREVLVETYARHGSREWLAELKRTEDFTIPWQFLFDMVYEKLPVKLPPCIGRTGTYESVRPLTSWRPGMTRK
ncbi:hypothetical protein J3458_022039 [Metarhizium acridum]|uniref:BTB domain-containing protein n=1 Tax=Metarhizium acridum (strain CQMa 102) TaxID=655827 RepID=E9E9G1_METAQ|nr:uncharacterized protein MAC_06509 [Metarhizium acridum CQMa 102]EFY87401.1 hypothetical protein MAC_06509 [Metarhizium acridum CQMa 102]KAG8405381.1 hypothetical protein J3458_022039 [Metarhizium acridum]